MCLLIVQGEVHAIVFIDKRWRLVGNLDLHLGFVFFDTRFLKIEIEWCCIWVSYKEKLHDTRSVQERNIQESILVVSFACCTLQILLLVLYNPQCHDKYPKVIRTKYLSMCRCRWNVPHKAQQCRWFSHLQPGSKYLQWTISSQLKLARKIYTCRRAGRFATNSISNILHCPEETERSQKWRAYMTPSFASSSKRDLSPTII